MAATFCWPDQQECSYTIVGVLCRKCLKEVKIGLQPCNTGFAKVLVSIFIIIPSDLEFKELMEQVSVGVHCLVLCRDIVYTRVRVAP